MGEPDEMTAAPDQAESRAHLQLRHEGELVEVRVVDVLVEDGAVSSVRCAEALWRWW